jgi:hypothetical protein
MWLMIYCTTQERHVYRLCQDLRGEVVVTQRLTWTRRVTLLTTHGWFSMATLHHQTPHNSHISTRTGTRSFSTIEGHQTCLDGWHPRLEEHHVPRAYVAYLCTRNIIMLPFVWDYVAQFWSMYETYVVIIYVLHNYDLYMRLLLVVALISTNSHWTSSIWTKIHWTKIQWTSLTKIKIHWNESLVK